MQLRGKGTQIVTGEARLQINGLTCLLVCVTLYSTLGFEKNIFLATVTGSNKNNVC